MIYIGIGSNLSGPDKETPLQNCYNAIEKLKKEVNIDDISSWYESEPVPVSSQPWFINGIIKISTNKSPLADAVQRGLVATTLHLPIVSPPSTDSSNTPGGWPWPTFNQVVRGVSRSADQL